MLESIDWVVMVGSADQLTDDVIEQLLNLTLMDDPSMERNAHAALHNASMLALVRHAHAHAHTEREREREREGERERAERM